MKMQIQIPEGYELDKDNSSDTCIRFRKIKKAVTCWEDLETVSGWYCNHSSEIKCTGDLRAHENNKNIFATEGQAEASMSLAMLSQLLKEFNKGWKPDWTSFTEKRVIAIVGAGNLEVFISTRVRYFLAFETEHKAALFARLHRDLILKASPLL